MSRTIILAVSANDPTAVTQALDSALSTLALNGKVVAQSDGGWLYLGNPAETWTGDDIVYAEVSEA